MSHDTLGTGLAWFQLVFGGVYFVWGLRSKRSPGTQYFAPLGLWFIIGSVCKFLDGLVPDAVLLSLYVLSFAAVGIWFVRTYRALNARASELARQREQSKS
jgi:hypothetical protein